MYWTRFFYVLFYSSCARQHCSFSFSFFLFFNDGRVLERHELVEQMFCIASRAMAKAFYYFRLFEGFFHSRILVNFFYIDAFLNLRNQNYVQCSTPVQTRLLDERSVVSMKGLVYISLDASFGIQFKLVIQNWFQIYSCRTFWFFFI